MEEQEVKYASVVFKANKQPPPEAAEKKEETVYDEVKMKTQAAEPTAATNRILPDLKANSRTRHLACFFGILCIILLVSIIIVSTIYIPTQSQKQENQPSLLAENQNLTNFNRELISRIENLKREHNIQLDNLTQSVSDREREITNLTQFVSDREREITNLTQSVSDREREITNLTQSVSDREREITNLTQSVSDREREITNLTQSVSDREREITNLTQSVSDREREITNLTAENRQLVAQNEELEMESNELRDRIEDMATVESNVSRAQWSIDAYCQKTDGERKCISCQKSWRPFDSNCFNINNPGLMKFWKTWDRAQTICSQKGSELAVLPNEAQKDYVKKNSWRSSGTNGYWIGLRAENGKWKWVNGSDLTEASWIQGQPVDGHCVISVGSEGFKAADCNEEKRYICRNGGLTI